MLKLLSNKYTLDMLKRFKMEISRAGSTTVEEKVRGNLNYRVVWPNYFI